MTLDTLFVVEYVSFYYILKPCHTPLKDRHPIKKGTTYHPRTNADKCMSCKFSEGKGPFCTLSILH